MENTILKIEITENFTKTDIHVKNEEDAFTLMSELIKTIIRLAETAHEKE